MRLRHLGCVVMYAASAATAQCLPPPISLSVTNVTLPNGQNNRGVPITIGNSPQQAIFLPGYAQNSSLVYAPNGLCGSSYDFSDDACMTFRGGFFDPIASSTQESVDEKAYPVDHTAPEASHVADTWRLDGGETVLDSVPMKVALSEWNQGWTYQTNTLGIIGSNSTFLDTLIETAMIPSRTWSYFWGRGYGVPSALDGGLVLGGYDRAKVVGEEHVFDLEHTDDCLSGLWVNVTDIVLNNRDGSDVSIFPKQASPERFCIEPSLPLLAELPLDPYFDNWLTEEGLSIFDMGRVTNGLYFYSMLYPDVSDAFEGDLTIALSSGLRIRVINDNFVLPNVYLDPSSGAYRVNDTQRLLALDSLQDITSDKRPSLGEIFLAAAYLTVNQDAGTFSLRQAYHTTRTDVVAVDAEGREVAADRLCATADGGEEEEEEDTGGSGDDGTGSSSAPAESSGSGANTAEDDGASTGAIAGGVVGGVLGLALVGLGAWYLLRRRRRQREAAAVASDDAQFPSFGGAQASMGELGPGVGGASPYPKNEHMETQEMPNTDVGAYRAYAPREVADTDMWARNRFEAPDSGHERHELP